MSKFYITTPIYYVNARPHIGHAYTTLAADVLSRFHAQQGDEVFFLTGTDEHGAKVAEAAEAAGKDPQTFTNEVAQLFQDAWKALNISNSDFIRTTEARHQKGVERFLHILKDAGALYEGEYSGLYCTGCENFITEKELVDGLCPHHNRAPERVTEKNWFFKLSDYVSEIKKLIEGDTILIRPDFAKKEALGLIAQSLADFSVTRESVAWGLKLPWDESQTVYVWVEALMNYITASDWNNGHAPWPADMHVIGKDILKFHAIFWSALLLAAKLPLPKELFVHGYFSIDGKKMSKSLGNVIDPVSLVDAYGVDGARYLLLSQFPFGQDGDVKAEKFNEQYNTFFANGLGNIISRTATLVEKNFEGTLLPASEEKSLAHIGEHIAHVQFDEALKAISMEITKLDKLFETEKPWEMIKTDAKKAHQILSNASHALIALTGYLAPFFPETAEKIKTQFTADRIVKGEPLFPRK